MLRHPNFGLQMRIGIVVKTIEAKKIGFIRSADLKEDVFFHYSCVQGPGRAALQEGEEVEYEIDEFLRMEYAELKATLVQRSRRPQSIRLKPSDAPKLHANHHPNARRRRPVWKNRSDSSVAETTDEHLSESPETTKPPQNGASDSSSPNTAEH